MADIRVVELVEGDQPRVFPEISEAEVIAISKAELGVVSRLPGDQGWRIAPGSKVGTVRIGHDLQLTVRPKVKVGQLFFMMGFAKNPKFWRDEMVEVIRDDNFVIVLADLFQMLCGRSVERGLLQGYVTVEESSPVLRGRLRTSDQISRHGGIMYPLEITFDDFTTDITENRILLAALFRLMQIPTLPGVVRQRLQKLRLAFNGVTPVEGALEWQETRLNRHYQPALHIAELILAGESVNQSSVGSPVAIRGFVVDMWKVYEDFVSVALGLELQNHGGEVRTQFRTHLDQHRQAEMRPDMVWSHDSEVVAVLDAKYKVQQSDTFHHPDLFQVNTYASVFGLDTAHLIYSRDPESADAVPDLTMVGSDIRIKRHTLDLSLSPQGVLEQISQIAGMIVESAKRPKSDS